MKDAGSKKKLRWLYVDKLVAMTAAFIVSIGVFLLVHQVQLNFVYNEPTVEYNLIGESSAREKQKAMEKTKRQNVIIKQLKGDPKIQKDTIVKAMRKSK